MNFQIKHRFSSRVLFELECESLRYCIEKAVYMSINLRGADLRGADLRGADLRGVDFRGADLRGVDMIGANMIGANMIGANMIGVYLRGEYGEKIKIKKTPLQILGLRWDIIVFDSHMKIGCQFHSISDWKSFDNDTISKMDSKALELWKKSKDFILNFCYANERK